MKRNIIKIDESKCNGCGVCIPDCPEGALQIIDGKARLVSDLFCDGLGACIKTCPQGAMSVEKRDAEPYDECKVMDNVVRGGANVIKAHLKHLKDHGEDVFYAQAIDYLKRNNYDIPKVDEQKPIAGCPGMMQKELGKSRVETGASVQNIDSELRNWPIQLKLLNPNAPYLKGADLLIAADCTAFAYANFHQRFIKNKVLIMFCPKLDANTGEYVSKLENIFRNQEIRSITIVHMEVPCCSGVEIIVTEAIKNSSKTIIMKDYTISLEGELI